jgi:hypothetical protein
MSPLPTLNYYSATAHNASLRHPVGYASPTHSNRARKAPSIVTFSKNIACGRSHQPVSL